MFDYLLNIDFLAVAQVILIDLVLAGDNAIVVGIAAASVEPKFRKKVIFLGVGLAVVLRIIFAAVTMQLLGIVGLTFAGGVLLLWVCWKLYTELREHSGSGSQSGNQSEPGRRQTVSAAIFQVAIADISMSLDNVLAVAGVAKDDMTVLVIGLALSVILMGVGAGVIARLLERYRWIGYLGLLLIVYVAFEMTWRGGVELLNFLTA
jgi:YjbE family integral membrane protein